MKSISPWWKLEGRWVEEEDTESAIVGTAVAQRVGIASGDSFIVVDEDKPIRLKTAGVVSTGGLEDNQSYIK